MPSPPGKEPPASERDSASIELSVAPEPTGPHRAEPVRASSAPPTVGVASTFHFGPQQQSPLIVPPDRLPPLSSEQVTQVLLVAEAKEKFAHERAMEELKQRGQSTNGARGLAFVVLLIVGIFVYFASKGDHFDVALQVLIPLATGVAGFVAGRGYQQSKTKGG